MLYYLDKNKEELKEFFGTTHPFVFHNDKNLIPKNRFILEFLYTGVEGNVTVSADHYNSNTFALDGTSDKDVTFWFENPDDIPLFEKYINDIKQLIKYEIIEEGEI
ncbi:hypothetical protein FDI40_gp495 [Agrobacterium phage Atu_ph07]|uniref:Uncharacterized protein n=1 Tax=Agrobacterium phage Atu_ph07 TaxID=2024264 RepID=A0A2L0V0D0_9CAUD|nr:hypothetical protein FDI40_gp495 [Agrobacterium phage Atu_ph07]AUZ95254.1 hypothetical protein [Agrobacterium phage Atu_ph07]